MSLINSQHAFFNPIFYVKTFVEIFPELRIFFFFGNAHTVNGNISKHLFSKCSCHRLNFFWKEITFSLIFKVSLLPWKGRLCVYFFKNYLLDDILTIATHSSASLVFLSKKERMQDPFSGSTAPLNTLPWDSPCGTRDWPGHFPSHGKEL